jgi:hypothetical protein
MGFGHVGAFRNSVSRLLPVPFAGNAEVRAIALSEGTAGAPCVKNLLLTALSLWPLPASSCLAPAWSLSQLSNPDLATDGTNLPIASPITLGRW